MFSFSWDLGLLALIVLSTLAVISFIFFVMFTIMSFTLYWFRSQKVVETPPQSGSMPVPYKCKWSSWWQLLQDEFLGGIHPEELQFQEHFTRCLKTLSSLFPKKQKEEDERRRSDCRESNEFASLWEELQL